MGLIDLVKKQQAISNDIRAAAGEVQLPEKTPVNAVAASVDVEASEIAVMNNDDTIVFQGETFTKASGTTAASGEFADAAGLAACVNELLDDWTAAENTDVTITSDTKSAYYNGLPLVGSIVEATTAGFDSGVTASSADITAATVTELDNGDTVVFAETTFTKAAATDNAAGEFADIAGLASAINELLGDDWTAAVDGDLTVTADDNTTDLDGLDVVVSLLRETADGVSGTVGKEGEICADGDYVYVAKADNKSTDANWLRASVSSF